MEAGDIKYCNQLHEAKGKMQSIALSDASVREYLDRAVSENTKKAYRADIEHFRRFGGEIPCSPDFLAAYVSAYAGVLACATITRKIAAISKAHTMQGYPSPARNDLIRMTMKGVRRVHGRPQAQVNALMKEDVIIVLNKIPDDLRGCRDRAAILLGFSAALRRSELCQVRVEDLNFTNDGLILTIPRSKTDQTGEGRQIGVPLGRSKICPVQSLRQWLEKSGITEGYVFRGIDKGAIVETPLCDKSIANIIKSRAKQAGLDPAQYSGHSLRSGLASSAAQHGFSSWEIRRVTGHKSDSQLQKYIRIGSLFQNNASALF